MTHYQLPYLHNWFRHFNGLCLADKCTDSFKVCHCCVLPYGLRHGARYCGHGAYVIWSFGVQGGERGMEEGNLVMRMGTQQQRVLTSALASIQFEKAELYLLKVR